MTDTTLDHPETIVFPPLIPLATLVIACALQWMTPLGWIASLEPQVRMGVGLLVIFAGLAMTAAGQRALMKNGTNVSPSQPTTRLVTDGVFARTRNPLYVGGSLALCGVAVIFALDWMLLLMIPSCIVLHFAVVRREELYLEQKFGEAYRCYRTNVPRYFGRN